MIATGSRRSGLTKLGDDRGSASFPVIADWQEWWQIWGPRIMRDVGKQGWVLFMLDANEKQLEVGMVVSRVIRSKPEWNTAGWSEKEWLNVAEVTAEAAAWFDKNAPRLDSVPEYAQFLIAAQGGVFAALKRMGRELRALQEQGYSTVVIERRDDGLHIPAEAFLEVA